MYCKCTSHLGFGLAVEHSHHKQVNKGHGRLESRECWVITDRDELAYVAPQRQWPGLKGVAKINYRRNGNEESPTDTRYYICSYQAMAESLLRATRDHWGIENSLHWSWTWPLMKTAAGSGPATPARTWQWRGIGR